MRSLREAARNTSASTTGFPKASRTVPVTDRLEGVSEDTFTASNSRSGREVTEGRWGSVLGSVGHTRATPAASSTIPSTAMAHFLTRAPR